MNKLIISGKIMSELTLASEKCGEKFYDFTIGVPRLSGIYDTLPVVISEHILPEGGAHVGNTIHIRGQFRSYNKLIDGKMRLILKIFAQEILDEEPESCNEITLSGFICREPSYRLTPLNREITDLLIAVNRKNRSDYIPCIAWGNNARFTKALKIGNKVTITGRVQSREYQKNGVTRTAYEVSISNIGVEVE